MYWKIAAEAPSGAADLHTPFRTQLRIYCEYKGKPFHIVDHVMCWVNGNESQTMQKNDKNTFTAVCDLKSVEISHLQVMAVINGPSLKSLPPSVHSVKDVHITTGRIPIRSIICNEVATSKSYDPVQPDMVLVVENKPFDPAHLQGDASFAAALRHFKNVESILIPMSQDTVNHFGEKQIQLNNDVMANLQGMGMKLHSEGIFSTQCITSLATSIPVWMPDLDNAIDIKINQAAFSSADAVGMAAALLKITGISHKECINEDLAAKSLANLAPMIASDNSYANDMKPEIIDGNSPDFVIDLDGDGGVNIEDIVRKLMKQGAAKQEPGSVKIGFNVNEDITIPFSDVYLRSRGFTSDLRKGDCEDGTNVSKLIFALLKSFCMKVSARNDPTGSAKATAFKELKTHPYFTGWTDEELKGVIRQCGELAQFIENTSVKLILMSAKSINMEMSERQDNQPPAGHCAAMIVRGEMNKVKPSLITASMENTMSDYQHILAELTSPVRIESFIHRRPPSNEINGKMVLELRKQKYTPQSECQFYNKCTAMMAPGKDVGAWKHVGHVDGVFWNVVSCIGDTIPTLDNVIGVPIKEACTCVNSRVKGIKVQRSAEDQQEFERVIRYALPPVANMEPLFKETVSRPLQTSFINKENVPVVYIAGVEDKDRLHEWSTKSDCRYLCNFGSKTLAVHQVMKCDLQTLQDKMGRPKSDVTILIDK